jgi:phosphomannomutase
MAPYLAALKASVDKTTIEAASLRVVVDPLFGAGRYYLTMMLRELGVEVTEVNGETDPTFNGLHPEPIMPWVRVGAEAVVALGCDACFITDGDADRIGAIDDEGTYVSSHRLLALLIGHLVENRGQSGRVVRTRAGSNLLRRQCDRLGLDLTTKPIGFKWIYEEMLKGDVLIGGEESGGIGVPAHVRERDGLLMALMLAELMAQKGKNLRELVDDLSAELGTLEYARRDLRLTAEQKDALLATHIDTDELSADAYRGLFVALAEDLVSLSRGDGIKFDFASDAWLLVRPSGTEPLVRVYAEAADAEQVQALLDIGCALAQGEIA